MMKKLLPLLVIITAVLTAGCAKYKPEINSFDACVAAGNLVMESYPAQCRTSDGKVFTEAVIEEPEDTLIGGETDEHGCMIAAGYSWCDSKQKCLRMWEEDCPMTEELCKSGGGHWNECANRCQLNNQGKEGVACTMQCEQLCECGGITGFGCPAGHTCKMPDGVADTRGYCIPQAGASGYEIAETTEVTCKQDSDCRTPVEYTIRSDCPYSSKCINNYCTIVCPDVQGRLESEKLTADEALQIAKSSECTVEGRLTENYYHNENTRTWWIDLDLKKEGCSPACIVSEDTRTSEINWRCTGLIPETY